MSWRDGLTRVVHPDGRKLIGASFRGVPFFVATSSRTGGRRLVKHDFPLRDDPAIDDLGRAGRTFSVEGYVLGDGYLAERDALLSALEDRSGSGELVHPYYGIRPAICGTVTVNESSAEGGIASFSITFEDAPTRATIPVDAVDFIERVNQSAAAARTATKSEFAALYDIAGLPGFALASAQATLETVATGLETAAGPVTKTTQELAKLTQQIETLKSSAAALVREPGAILDSFEEALTTLADSAGAPIEALAAFLATYLFPTPAPTQPRTATRARELANQEAITAGLHRMVVVEAVRKCAAIAFETIDQAIEMRERVTDALDLELESADTTAYPALLDMRAALVSAVPGDTAHARVLTIERRVAVSSILLSYQLYGNVDENIDIATRNHVRNPGFMSGTLEVLSEG